MSLASLLRRWPNRGGRQSLLDEVVAEHGPALHRLAASYTPPGAAREDLEQEIVLALWRALPRYRREASLRTYVFRIAHNRCVDFLRSGRLERGLSSDVQAMPLASQQPSPERVVVARDELDRVGAALRRLPLGQRQALVLALEGSRTARSPRR